MSRENLYSPSSGNYKLLYKPMAKVIGRVSKQMIIYPRSTFTHDFPYFR